MSKPIFIHSLFRTGSTYIWNKFRHSDDFTCYYEPLHNELLGIPKESLKVPELDKFDFNKHPVLDKPYFWEFKDLILEDGGILNFNERFVAEEFCYNGNNPELKLYIDTLIDKAKAQPLFQFNRSALRTKWFKNNYEDSINIYLLRNARDNFASFERYINIDNVFFSAMDLVIIQYNLNQPVFSWLSKYIDLSSLKVGIESAIETCSEQVVTLTSTDRYMLFYTIWYVSLLFNSVYADFILDVNKLSDSMPYNNGFIEWLSSCGIYGVTFEDAALNTHDEYTLTNETFDLVESVVQANIRAVCHYE